VEDTNGSVPLLHWASGRVTQRTPVPQTQNATLQGGIMATQFFVADSLLETQIMREFPEIPDYNSDLF
jgi:hypothetical protein